MAKYSTYDGPEGQLLLAVDDDGRVLRLHFVDGPLPDRARLGSGRCRARHGRSPARRVLRGDRTEFDLALAPRGTPFQLEVWEQLRRIPYGETISYGELAKRVDRPGAARGRRMPRTARTPSPSSCRATA